MTDPTDDGGPASGEGPAAPDDARTAGELALLALELTTGVGALGGAWYGLAGAPDVPVEWLEGTPFRSYAGPSLILASAVGGSMLAAGASVLRRGPRRRALSTGAGVVLVGWLGTQVAMIGWRSPLQPVYLGVGVATVALARRLPVPADRARPRSRAAGARTGPGTGAPARL